MININEVAKDRRYNLQYFTRHIKYIGRKGKYKSHKIELDIKKNIKFYFGFLLNS